LQQGEELISPPGYHNQPASGKTFEGRRHHVISGHPPGVGNALPIETHRVVKFGLRKAGAERLHLYGRPAALQLEVQTFGEAVHPGLRGAVAGAAGALSESSHRGHVHHVPLLARHHPGQGRVGESHCSHHMEVVHLVLAFQVEGQIIDFPVLKGQQVKKGEK